MDSYSGDSGLVHRIETRLRQMIVRGELGDSAKLRQDHIAAEFGATAAPVREALRRLENARLVVSRPTRRKSCG
jgi:DNA-binding GntR family transcriptional regulator